MKLKRSSWSGALLRPLGHSAWGAEQTASGIVFRGGPHARAQYSDWSGPAELVKTLGFPTLLVPLNDGSVARLAGLQPRDAEDFIAAANDAFRRQFAKEFASIEEELNALVAIINRLEQPRRYPAACLLSPFLERAEQASARLPATFPDGVLPESKATALTTIRRFLKSPAEARSRGVQRFMETELSEMKAFFDTIESNPLTPEQRRVVVTDEDATLVLAGAGSGKTSVIVAKAAYLIERGIRRPEEILLLAYGKDAATEMADRIEERAGASVDAMTLLISTQN